MIDAFADVDSMLANTPPHRQDWVASLRDANGGEPFHAIIDLVSKEQATDLCEALGYYGHMVTVLGRVEQSPLPPFTRCLSLHEIALGAQHVYGTDRQWQRLMQAGENMLSAIARDALPIATLVVRDFATLPVTIIEAKLQGKGRKFLLRS